MLSPVKWSLSISAALLKAPAQRETCCLEAVAGHRSGPERWTGKEGQVWSPKPGLLLDLPPTS